MSDPALAEVQALEDLIRRSPAEALEGAHKWLAAHGTDVDPVLRQRVRLVRADGQARAGQPETSVLVMREINAWAVDHDVPWLRARSHRLLSSRFRRAGDASGALEHAISAVDLLPSDARPVERADHLLGLADALGEIGSFEQALRRYDEAGAIAQANGNVEQWLHVLNNVAYTHFQAGNAQRAVATAELLMELAARHDIELDVYDRDTIARAYTMVGRYDDAVEVLQPVIGATAPPHRAPAYDGLALGMMTLAEIQRLAGALDDAQASVDRALEICAENGLDGIRIDSQREQAEIHAARGQFKAAFELFKVYHAEITELRAIERETRARTLQAIYEADEARRDSDRFRELSVRDPLTGLRNRRFVDEQLGAQLMIAQNTTSPLTVAILDLDHFKNVNDQRSHDVGDRVLREVARILDDTVASSRPDGTTARLGGEEFLVVLPGIDSTEALELLHRLCAAVREHNWVPLTGDIPVTTSIGVACSPDDGVDRTPLLSSADRRLYAAKRAGRDRVVAHDAPQLESVS